MPVGKAAQQRRQEAHRVRQQAHWCARQVGDRDAVSRAEDLEDVSAVALRAVGQEDLVVGDVEQQLPDSSSFEKVMLAVIDNALLAV